VIHYVPGYTDSSILLYYEHMADTYNKKRYVIQLSPVHTNIPPHHAFLKAFHLGNSSCVCMEWSCTGQFYRKLTVMCSIL
jgi:hypothetical protein